MKNLILVVLILISGTVSVFGFNPPTDYTKLWERTDSLIDKGLPQSALEVVTQIYEAAKAEKADGQMVRAIIYRIRLISDYQEDYYEKSIEEMKKELAATSFPVQPLLHVMLAELYWNYYSVNRWKFYQRTSTFNFENEDIKTWTLDRLVQEVRHEYKLAFADLEALKKVPIDKYKPILNEDVYINLTPTLFDFVVWQAISRFENEEMQLTRPAVQFAVDQKEYFYPGKAFSSINLPNHDSISFSLQTLQLFQWLSAFHCDDADQSIMAMIEIERLRYVRSKSVLADKDSLYINSLLQIYAQMAGSKAQAEIGYSVAEFYYYEAAKYDPQSAPQYRWLYLKSLSYIKTITEKFPDTRGANNCMVLKEQIEANSIGLSTEKGVAPNIAIETVISHRNTNMAYIRILKMDPDHFRTIDRKKYTDELLIYLAGIKPLSSFKQALTDEKDYQSHSTSMVLPGLDKGYYIVLVSNDPDFNIEKGWCGYSELWVSNLTYMMQEDNNEKVAFLVTDRTTGAAIKGAQVDIFTEKYNYVTREYEYVKFRNLTTDANGKAYMDALPSNSDSRYLYADIRSGTDRYCPFSTFYMYPPYRSNAGKTYFTQFFTDRSIYRPGQTVYFKGIMLSKEGDKYSIAPGVKTNVIFYDANYQKINEMELTSNEFGTFTGTFTAPDNGLTGSMHLGNSYGNAYISVEEYKRPKFFVEFNPVKGNYKLGENITVTGNAKAYAGNNIDGAQVKYRVVRNARFPYWWSWWYRPMPSSAQVEITNGTAVTDENGQFTITFEALADPAINRNLQPVFNYTIYADVTDLNGETRSSSTWVGAGYKALILDANLGATLVKGKTENFEVNAENLSGQSVGSEVTVKIYAIETPTQTYRQRLLLRAEYHTLSREEYIAKFPMDAYEDEDQAQNFKRGNLVFSKIINTTKDSIIDLTTITFPDQGNYILVLNARDIYGEEVEYQQMFAYFKPENGPSGGQDIFKVIPIDNVVEPGQQASILLSTNQKGLCVFMEVELHNKIVRSEWITLNDEQQLITFPVTEEMRGNFTVHFACVNNNRGYTESTTIFVPWTNMQLSVEFETFRDKLQPGESEKWRIIIRGPKGEKVAAEMLAGMYDASLDAYKYHSWYMSLLNYYYGRMNWSDDYNFTTLNSSIYSKAYVRQYYAQSYRIPGINWFSYPMYYYNSYYAYRGGGGGYTGGDDYYVEEGIVCCDATTVSRAESDGRYDREKAGNAQQPVSGAFSAGEDLPGADKDNENQAGWDGDQTDGRGNADFSDVSARTNFNETAFFMPQLRTNENGDIILEFTMPESLTKWKFMALAHTQDLKTGTIEKTLVTQKSLMVVPFAPRFLREGDQIVFSAKISNISEMDLNGMARLQLTDPLTGKSLDEAFALNTADINFTAEKGKSTVVTWKLKVPFGIGAVSYKVLAKAGTFTDGEEMVLPILSNRMLVTEAMPMPIRGNQTRTYTFDKLRNNTSTTLTNHRLTLEFTSNPAWYAIQALPYLMEYPYECTEQTFSRYYANSIAAYIANSSPKIKAVFESWQNFTPEAFLSNLEKNQELKGLLLEETPWVLDAQNESERKKRVGLLFNLHRMARELKDAETKILKAQTPNGGFAWFKGMPDDRYITQHIVCGFGKLDHLGIKDVRDNSRIWKMVQDAVTYLDRRVKEDYDYIVRWYPNYKKEMHLSYFQIHYLYARSFFVDLPVAQRNLEAFDYFFNQAKTYWSDFNKYSQGMIALALNRYNEKAAPQDIIKSLRETAIHSEEMGVYWREFVGGYYWWEAPIESQALMVEVFDEVANDMEMVEELKIWLLKQKQVQDWKTTRATVEACYALLLRGMDILESDQLVEIKMGNQIVDPTKIEGCQIEAGTGYFKTAWTSEQITPEMGEVTVTKADSGIAWGALYWQYFEDLDKITPAATPISIKKQLFVERQSATGPKMEPVVENVPLKIGDRIKVRIEIRVDRDMEYVHMKDMRASCLEPVNVLSTTKYQDGLWYFENTRDASTNFFFDRLPKGTHVFEYVLMVTHSGNYSNGVTTIQCMYAPEFTSHSEGVRITVE